MENNQILELATSFPPIIGTTPKILILGSMPGLESLKQQRYYAHPRNAFWPIITSLYGHSEKLDYSQADCCVGCVEKLLSTGEPGSKY